MEYKSLIQKTLKNNAGSVSLSRMLVILIAFIVGAIVIAAVISAIGESYPPGMADKVSDLMT